MNHSPLIRLQAAQRHYSAAQEACPHWDYECGTEAGYGCCHELDDARRVHETGLADVVADHWSDNQLGHDLWLTRNGYGAGFWDHELPGADALADLVRTFPGRDLYVGDDGMVYAS